MRQPIKEALLDCSTVEEFRFFVRCAECGKVWRSRSARFSKADSPPETEGKRVIFRTLYERERTAARNRAAAEFVQNFNLCPICGRLVCDDCFRIGEDLDLCVSCARQLEVQGQPVLNGDHPEE
mgnify:FL=1